MRQHQTNNKPEQGDQAVSAVLIMPLVLVLVFAFIQVISFYFANTIAHAAAQTAAETARLDGSSPAAGKTSGYNYLAGTNSLKNATVTVTQTPTTVTATVTGTSPSFVPILKGPPINTSITMPKERWINR